MKFNCDRRKVNPHTVVVEITNETGDKPKRVTAAANDSFLVEVASNEQGLKMLNIKDLAGLEFQTSVHEQYNSCEGIVYLQEYDIDNVEEFTDGLKEIRYC